MRHSVGNTIHFWDGTNIAAEKTGSTVTVYFRSLNLIYSQTGNTKTFYVFNGHGDVIALTNASGTTIRIYIYNAFGVEDEPSVYDTNPFRYCGEYYDTETKTLYLRARYYDASTGRFTAEDPIKDGANWYSYCGGNPAKYKDYNGLWKDEIHYNDTYSWAIKLGYSEQDAEIIAKSDRSVDDFFGSQSYMPWALLFGSGSDQSYHFDIDSSDNDSRLQHARENLYQAIELKNEADKYNDGIESIQNSNYSMMFKNILSNYLQKQYAYKKTNHYKCLEWDYMHCKIIMLMVKLATMIQLMNYFQII